MEALSTMFNSNGPIGMLSGMLQENFNLSAGMSNIMAPIASMAIAGLLDMTGLTGGYAMYAVGTAIGLEVLNSVFPDALPAVKKALGFKSDGPK